MSNPNNYPAPAMVYGGAPMMSDDGPAPFAAITQQPSKFDLATVEYRDEAPAEELASLTDELATLRADNAARGVLIEELRAERDAAQFANRQAIATAAELDAVRSERGAALNERDALRYNVDKLESVRRDRDKYFEAWRRTLHALNAVVNATVGEP